MTMNQIRGLRQLLSEQREKAFIPIRKKRKDLVSDLTREIEKYNQTDNKDEKLTYLCNMYMHCLSSIIKRILREDNIQDNQKGKECRISLLKEIKTLLNKPTSISKVDDKIELFMLNVEDEALELGYNIYESIKERLKDKK
nr:MAG TPA: hypothetical protein [Caudoviricetes sp.]